MATNAHGPAFDAMRLFLEAKGLGELVTWAWDQLTSGNSETQIMQSLREQPVYRRRFRAIFDREAKGLPPVSVDEVLAYEKQASALMRAYGFPPGFYDSTDDFADMIGANMSVVELEQRLNSYAEAAEQAPVEARTELERLYGITPGNGLAAFFADPDAGLQAIQRQWRAAQTSGSAVRSGFGQLDQAEAERLQSLGAEPAQTAERFGEMARSTQVTGQLAGENEDAMSRESQLAVVDGDVRAQEELERRRRKRQAVFEGGGGYASGDSGFSGLGSSDRT